VIPMDPDIGNLHAHSECGTLEIRSRIFNRSRSCRSRSSVRNGPKLRLGHAIRKE
jgi:hypothetical protein